MKINEFLSTLPPSILSGDQIILPDDFFKKMFHFCELNSDDVFYYLGIGHNYRSLLIAEEEFHVKKAVGIDIDYNIIQNIKQKIPSTENTFVVNEDVINSSLSEATVIFAWFIDNRINDILSKKYEVELKDGARVISIWSPPCLFIPDKIDFPLLLCKKPFTKGQDVREQLKAIYGNDCIDFTASWRLAEKYISSFRTVESQSIRFLNILYSVIIWFNARELDLVCEKEIPPPVKSYVGIMKYFFDIDLTDLLTK